MRINFPLPQNMRFKVTTRSILLKGIGIIVKILKILSLEIDGRSRIFAVIYFKMVSHAELGTSAVYNLLSKKRKLKTVTTSKIRSSR